MNIGDEIINKIVSGKLFTVGCAKCDESNCVVLWSSGASEQIEAIATVSSVKEEDREQLIALIKAAFSAGFRLGKRYGEDAATAYEWGSRTSSPGDPDEAWKQDVEPFLNAEGSSKLDPLNREHWDNL